MSPSRTSVPPVVLAQSRAMSFVEAVANVLAGYGIALLTQVALFPTFGLHLAMTENVLIAGVFTGVSLARSFVLRRPFERLRVNSASNETAALGGGGSKASEGVAQPAMR